MSTLRKVGDRGSLESARALRDATAVLQELESVALSDVARLLSETTKNVQTAVESLERVQPEDWLTPEKAARYVGYEWPDGDDNARKLTIDAFEKMARSEGVPYHMLSPRQKRYNRREVDAWLLAR